MSTRTLDILIGARNATHGVFSNVRQQLKGIAASLFSVKGAMTAAASAYGIQYALRNTVGAAADFSRNMDNVATMLSDRNLPLMKSYNREVQTLAIEYGQSTQTLSKGLYDILSASVAPTKAMKVLATASKAATAGVTDTGTAADALTTVLNAYKVDADKAEAVSDQLFTTVQRGKTTFAELAENIGKAASLAYTGGLSLTELLAGIATLTRAGVSTEEAMTQMNAIVAAFLSPANEAAAAARAYGIELSSATLKSRGLAAVLKQLAVLSPEALAGIFPNVRALKGIAGLRGDLAGLHTDIRMLNEGVGATDKAFGRLAGGLSQSLASAKESLKALAVEIGTALTPAIKAMTNATSTSVQAWRDTSDTFKSVLVAIAEGLGAVWIFNKAFTFVTNTIRNFGEIMVKVVGWAQKLGTALASIGAVALGFAGASLAVVGYALHLESAADAQQELLEKGTEACEEYKQIAARNAEMAKAQQAAADAIREQTAAFEAQKPTLQTYAQLAETVKNAVNPGRNDPTQADLSALFNRGLITWEEYLQAQEKYISGLKEMREAGRRVWQETRTPLEEYAGRIADLRTLLKGSFIDVETYNRALEQAYQDVNARLPSVDEALQKFWAGRATSSGGGVPVVEGRLLTRAPGQAVERPIERTLVRQLAALKDEQTKARKEGAEQVKAVREQIRELQQIRRSIEANKPPEMTELTI